LRQTAQEARVRGELGWIDDHHLASLDKTQPSLFDLKHALADAQRLLISPYVTVELTEGAQRSQQGVLKRRGRCDRAHTAATICRALPPCCPRNWGVHAACNVELRVVIIVLVTSAAANT
jgi:hypothetical protein|tara:strand:- start:393 stop:752 length:360 start_codon:yes stop_codon:yes gene_type:complete